MDTLLTLLDSATVRLELVRDQMTMTLDNLKELNFKEPQWEEMEYLVQVIRARFSLCIAEYC